MTDQAAAKAPMNIIESGPAGGVVGAEKVAHAKGLAKIITFDMGGTTAKASMVEDGHVMRAQEQSVGAGIMAVSRLLTGAGYQLKVPAVDLAEIGAGGGSHVWIDAGGALQIGPHSAGASPGPVCYGKGGTVPTVTDANVVLGYINPRHLVGGALGINADLAHKALESQIAKPLGMSVEQAAYGAHRIAASNMIRAIRAVSTERGRDPREFALFAFGGNGPLFAGSLAEALGIRRIVVPSSAGLFSSFGLLYADVEHHLSRTFRRLLRKADLKAIGEAWDALAANAKAQLEEEGFAGASAQVTRSAAMHYQGQSWELVVPVPEGPMDATMVAKLEDAFGAEHERVYGHRAGPEEPVELVNIQVLGRGLRQGSGVPEVVRPSRTEPQAAPTRRAYFGTERGWVDTRVLRRSDLTTPTVGPVVVEEYDSTTLVPPGATASLDKAGNIMIEL
jgi:N-methylhydantoinase A